MTPLSLNCMTVQQCRFKNRWYCETHGVGEFLNLYSVPYRHADSTITRGVS